MTTFLDTILAQKRIEVAHLRANRKPFEGRTSPKRPFVEALDRSPELAVIAEIKKASPSRGIICRDFDPVKIADGYVRGGAAAISVLTDEKFFQGGAEYLCSVRSHTALPILRKDFIVDILQVEETAAMNADAMLLIAEALDATQLRDLYQAALSLDIDPLVELHALSELEKVLAIGPRVIGINNRDLSTFVTDIETTLSLIREIPPDIIVVAESGIGSADQARTLQNGGVRALLVGETLMRADDPVAALKALRRAGAD
jgi:indole-3-glycerol phosphate synthase